MLTFHWKNPTSQTETTTSCWCGGAVRMKLKRFLRCVLCLQHLLQTPELQSDPDGWMEEMSATDPCWPTAVVHTHDRGLLLLTCR